MISLRDMQDGFYYLDEENYCVVDSEMALVNGDN